MPELSLVKIYVKGNFLIYTNETDLFFADNVENILLSKNSTTSTSYYLYMRGINKLINDIAFSTIADENYSSYISQEYFENYIYTYTGNRVSLPLVSIGELNDVAISAPSNGQVLEYNATSGKWENVSPSALGGDMNKSVYDTDNDGVVDSSEKLEFIGKNSTGTTIAKTKVVYISGATGQLPNITLADASLEITSSKTIGITRTSIANNADGYVITHGKIHDVNTSAFADGDMLWLSETAGEFTNVAPSEPAHAVFIGYVAYAHPTAGKIILHIQNGYELNELHGVSVSSEVNNDVLTYETSSGLWKNKQVVAEPPITSGTISQYWRGDKSWQTLNATSVGLGNVPNTDATNPANIIQTSSYRFVTDAEKAIWNATNFIPDMKGNETFRGVNYSNNSTTEVTSGGITMATTGSTIARSVSSTNYATKQIRKGFYGSTVSAGRYTGTRGSALLFYIGGGFKYTCDVYISDTAYGSGCRQFYGMAGQTTDLAYTDTVLVSSLINCFGVGSDSADTNLQIFHNDGTGTCTKIDLGANFPANRTAGSALTTVYSIELFNAPNTTSVLYRVTNKETGAIAQETLSSDLPLGTQGLNFFASRCMGAGITNTGQFDLLILGVYSL
jgi:hypothetical protein